MEVKKEYAFLFNVVSDAIGELKEALRKGERCLQMLENAQQTTEEMHINDDDDDE